MSETQDEGIELRPRPWTERLRGTTLWLVGVVALAVIWLIGWSLVSAGRQSDARRAERENARPKTISQSSEVPGFLKRDPERRARRSEPEEEPITIPAFVERGPQSSGRMNDQQKPDMNQLARQAEIVPSGWRQAGQQASTHPSGLPNPGQLRSEILSGLAGFQRDEPVEVATETQPQEDLSQSVEARSRESIQSAPILPRGAMIPVTMARTVQTDGGCYPTAIVRRPVYSRDGELLIEAGSLVHGACQGSVLNGVGRLFVRWDRIDTPSGERLDLSASLPSGALDGSLGTEGKLKTHFWRTLRDAVLISVVSAGAQLAQPEGARSGGLGISDREVVAEAVALELSRVATARLEENLNRAQTIIVKEGARFNLVLNRDLVMGGV